MNLSVTHSYMYLIIALFISFPFITSLDTVQSICKEGFVEYRDECYRAFNDSVEWHAAELACSRQGGSAHLISIMDALEDYFIIDNFAGKNDLWIGFSIGQVDPRDRFVWSDNWPTYYTNWGKNEPKLRNRASWCTVFREDGTWGARPCSEKKGYICKSTERSPPAKENIKGSCFSSSWIDGKSSKCYYIDETPRIFIDAVKKCSKFDGELASFHSKKELLFLLPHIQDLNIDFWLGLTKVRNAPLEWFDSSPVDYLNWAVGEPNDEFSGEDCVEMHFHALTWNDVPCTKFKGTICQTNKIQVTSLVTGPPPISKTSEAPSVKQSSPNNCISSSWIDVGSSKCYYINTSPIKFGEAVEECRKFGPDGVLASFHSQEELLLLFPHVNSFNIHLWLGLTKCRYGPLQWLDSSPVDYLNWAVGQPNDEFSGEDCVEMYFHDLTWNDIPCTELKGFICQTNKLTTTAALVTTTPSKYSVGRTAGIVVGVSFAIAALVGLYYYLFKRKSTQSESSSDFEYLRHNSRDEEF